MLVADGGNTAVWAMMFHQMRVPNTILSTFKFGMLGAGVAQALGAAVARPGEPVCCIIGDGAMGFHPQEIETAVRNGLRVDLSRALRQAVGHGEDEPAVRAEADQDADQEVAGARRDHQRRPRRDPLRQARPSPWARTASASPIRVSSRPAIERALASGGPAVIHVDVDPVKHMWAPGLMHFKDMHLEPKGK